MHSVSGLVLVVEDVLSELPTFRVVPTAAAYSLAHLTRQLQILCLKAFETFCFCSYSQTQLSKSMRCVGRSSSENSFSQGFALF